MGYSPTRGYHILRRCSQSGLIRKEANRKRRYSSFENTELVNLTMYEAKIGFILGFLPSLLMQTLMCDLERLQMFLFDVVQVYNLNFAVEDPTFIEYSGAGDE